MVGATEPALGLSIGATNLAAVAADHPIIRKPVLTLYPQRLPEVGLPSENPGIDAPGLVITGFVNRVGDPRGVVAADGSVHIGQALIADAMRALSYAATGGHALPENLAVTFPSHWDGATVDALGATLSTVPEWSDRARPLLLIPDAAAILLAVQTNPGVPDHGTVAVCDFGGSGTSITLMDAAGDYRALAPTVRHRDFSGDLIDQALLSAVIANMPSTASLHSAGTVAIGSLSRLRTGCRIAKEQLSTSKVATLTDGLAGTRGEIRVSRQELDEAIRASLDNFVAALDKLLARNGIRDLVAVVAAGGGANLPAVTTTLSHHFRVPVVTTPRPQLTAAVGAALRASRGPDQTGATAPAHAAAATATARAPQGLVFRRPVSERRPEATATVQAPPATAALAAQAWSETGNARVAPVDGAAANTPNAARANPKRRTVRRYRVPAVAVLGTAAAVVLVGAVVAFGLSVTHKSATTPMPGVSTSPVPPPSRATVQPPTPQAPAPPATDTQPPATVETPTTTVLSATPQASPPAAAAPPRPVIPRAPAIPQIPPIPGVNAPIPGLDRVNQVIQGIGGDLGLRGIPPITPQLAR